MLLKYNLPKSITDSLPADEKLYYSVPFDIDSEGNLTDNSYLVVTAENVYAFEKEKLKSKIAIANCKSSRAEVHVGCGILIITEEDCDKIFVNYSSKHLSRYAYIARGINILASGRFEEVESNEYERMCPKCGRAIPPAKRRAS